MDCEFSFPLVRDNNRYGIIRLAIGSRDDYLALTPGEEARLGFQDVAALAVAILGRPGDIRHDWYVAIAGRGISRDDLKGPSGQLAALLCFLFKCGNLTARSNVPTPICATGLVDRVAIGVSPVDDSTFAMKIEAWKESLDGGSLIVPQENSRSSHSSARRDSEPTIRTVARGPLALAALLTDLFDGCRQVTDGIERLGNVSKKPVEGFRDGSLGMAPKGSPAIESAARGRKTSASADPLSDIKAPPWISRRAGVVAFSAAFVLVLGIWGGLSTWKTHEAAEARRKCRAATDLLNIAAPSTLAQARDRLFAEMDRNGQTVCYKAILLDKVVDLPHAVLVARGLFETNQWVGHFPELVKRIVEAVDQSPEDIQRLTDSYRANPGADVGSRLLAGESIPGISQSLLGKFREIDEWLNMLPALDFPTHWTPPWLNSKTLTAELAQSAMKWNHLSTCSNFPGIPGANPQRRPGTNSSLVIRKWIAALLGGVMVGGRQLVSGDLLEQYRLLFENEADHRHLNLREHVEYVQNGMERARSIVKEMERNSPGSSAVLGKPTIWPMAEELPTEYLEPIMWCQSLNDMRLCDPAMEPAGVSVSCNSLGMGQADCVPVDGGERGICLYYHKSFHPN